MARKKAAMTPSNPAPNVIDPSLLAGYLLNLSALDSVKARAKEIEASAKAQEAAIKAALGAGSTAPEGYRIAIETKQGPCRPAWKDEWTTQIGLRGLDPVVEEEAVKARTKRSTIETLVVESGVYHE